MKAIHTILHPTDFSPESHYAWELACSLAKAHGAKLIATHVVPAASPVVGSDTVDLARAETAQRDLRAYREEMLGKLRQIRSTIPNLHVEHVLGEGDVAQVVVRTADERACDLIVMGTHGRSRLYQFMMGSSAAAVSRSAHCPVVTVRLPAEST